MKRARAFTLVEVLVAIAIFILLAGGIFATVQTGFTASSEVAEAQLHSERFRAFQQFLRRLFLSLPPDATLELRIRKDAARGDFIELLIEPVPGSVRFGPSPGDGMALTAVPDGKGRFTFSMAYFETDNVNLDPDSALENADWMPLLPDVTTARWKFADARNPILSETWQSNSGRPGLAELELELLDGTTSVFDFWIPPVKPSTFRNRGVESRGANAPADPDDSNPRDESEDERE